MDPGDVLSPGVSFLHQRDNLVEMHRGGIAHQGVGRRGGDDGLRHQRAGVEADRAALDHAQSAHGDEVRRAWPGTDEVDFHEGSNLAA